MGRNFQILWVFFFLLYPSLTWALRPIVHYHDLVAGQGDEGYLDGSFENALFNHPEGLALSPDGNRLYVADTGNHCIRVIHMDEANRVDTLAGSGKPGNLDGPCAKSLLNRPTALAYLPNDQLWFFDSGNGLLRRVDLKTGTVITPAFHFIPSPAETPPLTTLSDIWNIQYLPQEKTLYFSQPNQGSLRKLNPSTLEISTILKGDPQAKQPSALCLYRDQLCFSDFGSQGAFVLDAASNTLTPAKAKTLCGAGAALPGQIILALTAWGDGLYAVHQGITPLERFFTGQNPLNPMSVWGPFLNQNGGDYADNHFFQFEKEPAGFLSDPGQERRFYMSDPRGNRVLAWKDYYFETYAELHAKSPGGLVDFEYPQKKPPHTFRILIVGDSASFSTGFGAGVKWKWGPNRMENMPKRLELMLNTEAAFEDWQENFEVVDIGYGGDGNPVFLWPYYEVPNLVKKFDIDLVIFAIATNANDNYKVYFERPMTSEGIPASKDDEEYALKPWKDRIPGGVAGDFYKRCLSQNWVSVDPHSKQLQFQTFNTMLPDPEARKDLMDMMGKPIQMMSDKISKIRTSDGHPVTTYLFLSTARDFTPGNLERQRSFWSEMADRCHFPFVDLTPFFQAFQPTYFPLDEWGVHNHLTPEGHYFYAYLMAKTLLKLNILPTQKISSPPAATMTSTPSVRVK